MKNYLKNELKHLPFTIILFVLLYSITAFATGTTLFASSEVKYNNSTSGIQSDRVQGAIDELYACASNYGAYNTRLTNTENTIGTGSLTTTNNTLIGGVNELNSNLATTNSRVNELNSNLATTNSKLLYMASAYMSNISISANGSKMFRATLNKGVTVGNLVFSVFINEYERWYWSCYQDNATTLYFRIMAGSSAISNKTVRIVIFSNVPDVTITLNTT